MILKINEYRLKNVKKYEELAKSKNETDNSFLDRAASVISKDTDMIQFNQDNITVKDYIELGKKLRELCSLFNTIFIVKNRVDVAKIIEADGVILEENEIPLCYAREILGDNAIIGKIFDKKDSLVNEDFDYFYPPFRQNIK